MNVLTGNRKNTALTLAGLAGLGIFGGSAYAAIPEPDGTIHGCYAKSSSVIAGVPTNKGDVRIVDAGAACKSSEIAISWNQKGVKGDTGATGASGATGAAGATGGIGPIGPTGPTGANGFDGATGAPGATGAQGPAGATGPAGPSSLPTVRIASNAGHAAVDPGSSYYTAVSISLPAGTWSLVAKGEAFSVADFIDETCDLLNGSDIIDRALMESNFHAVSGNHNTELFGLVGLVTFPTGGVVELACKADISYQGIGDTKILATRVSTG